MEQQFVGQVDLFGYVSISILAQMTRRIGTPVGVLFDWSDCLQRLRIPLSLLLLAMILGGAAAFVLPLASELAAYRADENAYVAIAEMIFDKIYDMLKWVAMYMLPALGTLYFALAGIGQFPYGEEVVGTLTAVDTFLSILLGISTAQYGYAGYGNADRWLRLWGYELER